MGEFGTVTQTHGLHNCGEFSQPLECLVSDYVNTYRKKVSYCFYKLTFPRKNADLFIVALIKREILTSLEVLYTTFCTRTRNAPVNREIRFTFTPNLYHVSKFPPYFPFTLYCFYTKISSFMLVLTIGIVRNCFYLLIFYSEKF